jgi:hypothetical protein
VPRPDSVLVKLAGKWIKRFYPISKFVADVSSSEGWHTQYVFYQSLLGVGCKVVGRSGNEVYMKCGDKLVGLILNLLFSIRKELESQIRELEEEEERKLIGGASFVEFKLDPIDAEVYGMEPVKVMRLSQDIFVESPAEGIGWSIYLEEPIDLYLYKVELDIGRQEGSFCIWLEPHETRRSPIDLIEVCYEIEEGANPRRYIEVSTEDGSYELADKEVERSILDALSKKSPIIDELISQAIPLLHESLKWLGIYVLY